MTQIDRRRLLALGAASVALPSVIEKAWAIDAKAPTGTIQDVQHVVILMQENRSFDHYFGTMNGVRGFGDRFPIPLPGGKTVWTQTHTKAEPPEIAPFPLNTTQTFAHMRVEGTPHSWADAQYAWDQGRMSHWPDYKKPHAMGYYTEVDIPFQWALANAFTLCDAYHCSFQGGTNTNRLFLWSGTNDGKGAHGGPSISNSHDTLPARQPQALIPYTWTTYPERLEEAGISWKIYEDMADNFGDNPLVGFRNYRESLQRMPGALVNLAIKGLATQHLDVLLADVKAGTLPSVSWVISPAKDSEHPGPSSPAQGADYIARVLEALTANPDVWAKTVLLVNYDENDGFFDHVPPPAPPSTGLGASTVDTAGEYHTVRIDSEKTAERDDLMGRPYGLGPRVPLFVISPFARGGWVNSEVFDHTSVIRFLEKRFGVMEPNISAWRRAVCGDLTSCFDFKTPNAALAVLPGTEEMAGKAAALEKRTTPPTPAGVIAPVQAVGVRRSRALDYRLRADISFGQEPQIMLMNDGSLAAVVHVHDCLQPGKPPRRYTIGAGQTIDDDWRAGPYDVFMTGPNGFHCRFTGDSAQQAPTVSVKSVGRKLRLEAANSGLAHELTVTPNAYADKFAAWTTALSDRPSVKVWDLDGSSGWYDFTVRCNELKGWSRRYAGRIDDGSPTMTDPAMGGAAVMSWS
jgi:phospholipase C